MKNINTFKDMVNLFVSTIEKKIYPYPTDQAESIDAEKFSKVKIMFFYPSVILLSENMKIVIPMPKNCNLINDCFFGINLHDLMQVVKLDHDNVNFAKIYNEERKINVIVVSVKSNTLVFDEPEWEDPYTPIGFRNDDDELINQQILIDSTNLKSAIKTVMPATSNDKQKHALMGILLDVNAGDLNFYASDGFMLFHSGCDRVKEDNHKSDDVSIFIPRKILNALSIFEKNETISIKYLKKNNKAYAVQISSLTYKIEYMIPDEDQYPNVLRICRNAARDNTIEIVFETRTLKTYLKEILPRLKEETRHANNLSSSMHDDTPNVIISMADNEMMVYPAISIYPEIESLVTPCSYSTTLTCKACFDAEKLLKILIQLGKQNDSQYTRIKFDSFLNERNFTVSPAVFECSYNEKVEFILMPVRK